MEASVWNKCERNEARGYVCRKRGDPEMFIRPNAWVVSDVQTTAQ
jgi:hypothetical protein